MLRCNMCGTGKVHCVSPPAVSLEKTWQVSLYVIYGFPTTIKLPPANLDNWHDHLSNQRTIWWWIQKLQFTIKSSSLQNAAWTWCSSPKWACLTIWLDLETQTSISTGTKIQNPNRRSGCGWFLMIWLPQTSCCSSAEFKALKLWRPATTYWSSQNWIPGTYDKPIKQKNSSHVANTNNLFARHTSNSIWDFSLEANQTV